MMAVEEIFAMSKANGVLIQSSGCRKEREGALIEIVNKPFKELGFHLDLKKQTDMLREIYMHQFKECQGFIKI